MICSLGSFRESARRSFLPGGGGQLLELEELHDLLLGELGGVGEEELGDSLLILQAGQDLLHPQHVAHLNTT